MAWIKFPLRLLRKFAKYALKLSLYPIAMVMPRRGDVWVFGAWHGHLYSDSSRYLYEYVRNNDPRIRAVWLTHEPSVVGIVRQSGGEAYLINSLRGFLIGCRAGMTIVNCGKVDINAVAATGSKIIHLWHGTPLKKIEKDDQISPRALLTSVERTMTRLRQVLFPFTELNWSLIVSPSPSVSRRFASAFGVELSRVKVTGSPRGDVILAPSPEPVEAVERLRKSRRGSKIILYAPTHRKQGFGSADRLFELLDIPGMEAFLASRNAFLLIKMHFAHRTLSNVLNGAGDHSCIRWLSEEDAADVNKMLPFVDILVTDFSGVYFDFLLLNRPVIFAPFDLAEYLSQDRELYEDYDAAIAGPKCENWDEVIKCLDDFLSGNDRYVAARLRARGKYNAFVDTNNCRRVFDAVSQLVDET